jgi:hypothetical protein
MAADEDEAKTLAALKIQARGRGMITRKQDRQALAQCSSPNRKEEARQVPPGVLGTLTPNQNQFVVLWAAW